MTGRKEMYTKERSRGKSDKRNERKKKEMRKIKKERKKKRKIIYSEKKR